jgi:hypothetical protein
MVEVALVLPIFIFTLMAVLEMGYFVAVASAVSSASREAARYGATVGTNTETPPVEHYLDCAGIRAAGRQTSGALVNLTDAQIVIKYDDGQDPPTDVGVPCVNTGSRPAEGDIERWDRIIVEVRHTYQPITPFLRPLMGNTEMNSIDRRSIVKSCTGC